MPPVFHCTSVEQRTVKAKIGNDQENAQSERDSHSKRKVGKLNKRSDTYSM